MTWQGYYRAGQALGGMGDWVGALKAFAAGLAQDPANTQLLAALINAAAASHLSSPTSPSPPLGRRGREAAGV